MILKKDKPYHSKAYRKFASDIGTRERFCAVSILVRDISLSSSVIDEKRPYIPCAFHCDNCPQVILCHGSKAAGGGGMAQKPDDRKAYLAGIIANDPGNANALKPYEAELIKITHELLAKYDTKKKFEFLHKKLDI